MTKQIENKPTIVTKVSLVDTFRAITPGTRATFDCREAGPYNSAQSCATRLNQAAGYKEFSVVSEDNGASYTVIRAK